MPHCLSLRAAVMLALPGYVLATEIPTLEPIVVTATRSAQPSDQALAAISVIDRAAIERSQARSLQELLRDQPGFTIANNGGLGKTSSIFLRGTESDHVLVLIDGIRVGSAALGTTALEQIPLGPIERIEILRGPASSLYGSEAIGGVIQIFTRQGGGPTRLSMSLGGGSDRSGQTDLSVSGGGEQGWYSASLGAQTTRGFNACTGDPVTWAGCATHEPDRDGYRQRSGHLRLGRTLTHNLSWDAQWLRSLGVTEYDGSYVNESETVQQLVATRFNFTPHDDLQLQLNLGRSWDDSDNFHDSAFMNRFLTIRDSLSVQGDWQLKPDWLVTMGWDQVQDSVGGTIRFAEDRRVNRGLFGLSQTQWGAHTWQLSARLDDNESFGQHSTGNLAWGWTFQPGLRLNAAVGSAFKAPSFNELYFPGYGNPHLEPESSRSLETGLRGQADWGRWTVNVFQTDIDQLIAHDAILMAPANIDRARIRGLELGLETRWSDWRIDAHVSWLEPLNRGDGAFYDHLLPRRAEHSGRLEMDRDFGHYRLGATLLAAGRRFDDLANSMKLDPYVTLDLRAEYRIDPHWKLQTKLSNLMDADYQTAAYYNQPGRALWLSLNYAL